MTLLWPAAALAVQGHGGAEGLVAHQIGHALFVMGLCYLFYKIKLARFNEPGWVEFKAFLWVLIFWNMLTFTGHLMREFVAPGKFSKVAGHVVHMNINGPWDIFFYLTRLDHLLLVPAFFLLFLALRKWRATA
ncbi:MAG: hypothetical protein ABFS18_13475 [Thermodesulfobacteriota bacterium]